MIGMTRRALAKWFGFAAIAAAGFWSSVDGLVRAAEPVRGRVDFDRIDVPADQPAAWPKDINRLVQIPRQEFVSLIEQLNSRNQIARSAWLKSAHYEATLVNDTLQGGLMTASVRRLGTRPTLLDVGQFSFALDHLKWQDRPAIWGSAADGRTWLLLDGSRDELLGEWSCQGRSFAGGIDFDLQLPNATVSMFDLRIPKEYSVYAPTAEVAPLTEDSAEKTRLWRIHCGSDSRCRITLVSRNGVEESRRALLVEHDMQVVVLEEDLRFQLNLVLDAIEAPVETLTLKVPSGLVIYSVFYGADTPVPIQRTADSNADGRLTIRLPGPLSGRRRTLKIDGIAVQKPGQPTTVPQIMVENCIFDGGHLAVTVQSPLQLRSIRSHGYRQRTTDGESLTFQQLTPDSQLILDVHRAQVVLSGRMLSLLDVDEDAWNLSSEIVWNSQTSGAYQTSCLYPPDWEITDVTLNGDSESTAGQIDDLARPREVRKLNWDVQTQSGGKSLLAIEFFEAIHPGQPRAVKVRARRPPPLVGQIDPVPLPQLLNCDVTEVILGVQIPNSMATVMSTDSRLERIARPTQSQYALPAEHPNFERRWYRADSIEGLGTLQLKPQQQPVHVKTETLIEALPAEYRLKYSIQYEQRDSQTDRVLVYLTESGPDVRWTWKGPQSLDLSAVRLPKSQHVEWSLPSKGELWEIRLPRAVARSATIEGVASSRWAATNRPALLFVPHAVDKASELKLSHPEELEVTVETDGLKPTGQRLSWWYAAPQVEIDLGLRNLEPSRDFPLMVSMQLRTLMSADADGSDLYRARLQLENGSAQESLRIKLHPSAVVQEAFVGGESIAVPTPGGDFVIPGLNAARRDTVELIYRVPARSNVFYERRRIVVPQVSAQVLGFFWEFGIPPSARIFSEPSGVRLSRSLPAPTWNERLLGPLGRTGAEAIFNPMRPEAWNKLLQPPLSPVMSEEDSGAELVTPIEWQVHQAVVPDAPSELWVELWNARRIQLLAWIILLLCLTSGIGLRIFGWARRDLLAAYWLGCCAAATFAVSAPYAGLLGAAIAGTLIALLLPRQLLQKVVMAEDKTVEFRKSGQQIIITSMVGAITIFGLAVFVTPHCVAQEPPTDEITPNKRPVVFVLVDRNGQPSETLPFVYVPRDALIRWKAMAGDQITEPDYLISSARYEVESLADGNLNLLAKYRVHLMRPTATVALPLSDVSLPDADACRVNGDPHAISALAGVKGYLIELSRDPKAEPGKASDVAERRAEDEVATFDVELRSRKSRPSSTGMELHLPPVAGSHFALSFPEPTPFAEIIGGRGSSARDALARSVECDLGSIPNVFVRWGRVPPTRKPAQVSASLLQHLELRPGYAELTFHLIGTIDDGSLDVIEFNLPQNAVVRKSQLRADDLLRSDVIIANDGQRRLRLIFDKSRQAPIRVDGALVLTQSDSLAQTPLPQFGLVSSDLLKVQYEHNWWGISSSADFRIESSNLDLENASMISADAYLNAWIDAADPRHPESSIPRLPQMSFELPEGTPTFTLIPLQPRRRAVQWTQSGFVGKRRLEWTLVGEIETSQAATFQSVLLVDRRLRIESISVMENDAERRTRWTESRSDPSRVVLFLSDKTQGRQVITLRGSLPITPGAPIVLPSIRPEDCEVVDARLMLTRDPDVDVTFTPPREWKNVSAEEHGATDGANAVGSFQVTDLSARATIQTSSRHSRCSSRAAALMRRIDGSGWQLKYRLEMMPEGESPVRIGLTFPATFTDLNSVTVERAEPAWHDPHDGVRQLDLLLNRAERSGAVVVQFETVLSEPKSPDWELSLPTPLSSNSHETLLVIEPESIWFPTGGLEVRVADLPKWSSSFYSDLPGGELAFRIVKSSILLQRDVVNSESRDPSIRLLDQRMWLHDSGRRSGITQAFLSSVREDIEFELPPRVYVTSVFLDEQPLALISPLEGRLRIPMTDAGTESLLTITWVVDGNAEQRRSDTEQFPWPREIKVERNLITILPDGPKALFSRSGVDEIGSLDQGLDRLETLLERHEALGDETRAAIANRWLLDQLQARLASRLSVEIKNPSDDFTHRLQRWNRIVDAINQLEPVPAAPPISWHARLLEGPVTDSAAAIRGHANKDGVVRFWQFDRRLILGICSIVMVLILIPVFRRTIRIEWSRWLHRHASISWLLLATVWWLFLTPSAFGPALLIVGALRAASQYTPIRPEA